MIFNAGNNGVDGTAVNNEDRNQRVNPRAQSSAFQGRSTTIQQAEQANPRISIPSG